eukprot:m.45349 g.45349  ORF g.45349 m.45349 type:complete len:510 (-) comp13084_c0_seq2:70-1599(-)
MALMILICSTALLIAAGLVILLGYALLPPLREWRAAFNIYHIRLQRKLSVPFWHFPAGHFGAMIDDFQAFFESKKATAYKFGAVPLWLANELVVVLLNPQDIRAIFYDNDLNYTRQFDSLYLLTRLFGKGIFAVDGEEWRAQHRILYKAFTQDNLRCFRPSYIERINSCCERMIAHCEDGSALAMSNEFQTVTLGVMCDVAFGSTLSPKEQDELCISFTYLANELTNPAHQIPLLRNVLTDTTALEAHFTTLYRVVDAAIHRRQQGDQVEHCTTSVKRYLIDLILSAGQDDTESAYRMDDETIRDNVVSFFGAGTETTATALSWTWSQLLKHPEVLTKARAEALGVTDDQLLTSKSLDEVLPYLTQVIKETMRLTPSVDATFGRTLKKPQQVGDVLYPKDARLIAFSYLTHRLPDYWTDPEVFQPERFDADALKPVDKSAYLPFGVGRRSCLGRHMAIEELQVLLCKTLQKLDVKHAGKPEDLDVLVYKPPLLQPKAGLLAVVSRYAMA